MEAGWATENAALPEEPVVVAQLVDPSTRVRCKNCRNWFCAAEGGAVDAVAVESAAAASAGANSAHLLLSPRTRKEFACQFHPGFYRPAGVTVASGVVNGWSCCKNTDELHAGCTFRYRHVEDGETTACLQVFAQEEDSDMSKELQRRLSLREVGPAGLPLDVHEAASVASDVKGQLELDDDDEEEDEENRSAAGDRKGHKGRKGEIVHNISCTDTLAGLSLRYGVSTQRIKEVNSIMGSSIVQYSSLIIPPDEKSKCSKRKPRGRRGGTNADALLQSLDTNDAANVQERRLIALRREMSLLGGGSEKEAAAYMSMADNDAACALQMYKQDVEWHRSEGTGYSDVHAEKGTGWSHREGGC